METPEGIIITISQEMIKERGYRNWLRNFLEAMSRHEQDWYYWMRQGTQPREGLRDKLQYVYLCIGGKVRFRAYFAGSYPGSTQTFGSGENAKTIKARAWVLLAGPLVRGNVPMKGFRGFRYTEKLF